MHEQSPVHSHQPFSSQPSRRGDRKCSRVIWLGAIAMAAIVVLFVSVPHHARAQAEAPAAEHDDDSWQVTYFGGQRIGYSRSRTHDLVVDGKKIIRTDTEQHMVLKRFGQSLKIAVVMTIDETAQGDMLSFRYEMQNPPANSTKTEGKVVGKSLRLTSTVGGRTQERTMPWDPEAKSPAYQDRLLSDPPLKPGDTRSFKTFMPELNRIMTVQVIADDYRTVSLLDGKKEKLLKIRVIQPGMSNMRAYLDEDGEQLKTEMDFIGTVMTMYTVPKDVALQAIAGAELDIAVNTLVRVKTIRNAHDTKRAVYRLTAPGQDLFEVVVSGGSQTVERDGDDAVKLTVTALKPPDSARIVPTEAAYLEATQYLQCRDYDVVQHARRAAANEIDHSKIAVRMEKYVRDKLTKKNFSTALASAAEVADSLEGDCTEHAVLLAAMLRAKKIPSRIAVGVVYVESLSSFGGHMWTEAYLGGKWIPLDATLGRGGIGAAHIKLAESSFADDDAAPVTTFLPLINILGNLKIEVIETE